MIKKSRLFLMPLPFLAVMLFWLGWTSWVVGLAVTAVCPVPVLSHPTIQSAVEDANCHQIQLTNMLYTENITVTRSLTMQGLGIYSTTVDGGASGPVFLIEPGLVVTLTDMTITNGRNDTGGGIHNQFSTLNLHQIQVFSNTSTFAGGGIFNDFNSVMTVANSAIHHNTAVIGGGLYNGGLVDLSNSQMSITGSVIYSNTADSSSGGGLYNNLEARLDIANSTLSHNRSENSGGGLDNLGFLYLTNVTMNSNDAPFGGGLYNSGQITVANSIIANSPNGGDCGLGWIITSVGHNLDSDGSCGLTAVGDITNTNPLLDSLQDNGGPTFTHALLPNSPALDAGDDALCQAAPVNGVDQRGLMRPQGAACDIGAFERAAPVIKPPTFVNFIPFVQG